MNPNHQIMRTSSPPRCSICQETCSINIARIIPCGHDFDLTCVQTLLHTAGRGGRLCPLCRTRITEIRYDFTPTGDYTAHAVGPAQPDSPLLSGPFIRPDEELRRDMTPEERGRVLELRRLRQHEDYTSPMWRFHWMTSYAVEGENAILVDRVIALRIVQRNGTHHSIDLGRQLLLQSIPLDDFKSVSRRHPPKDFPRDIADARAEIKEVLEKTISPLRTSFTSVEVNEAPHVLIDRRNLEVMTYKKLDIERRDWNENIMITTRTALGETFYAELWRENVDEQINYAFGIETSVRERVVRLVRQEIQGVMQLVRERTEAADRPTGYRDLDRASTGLLESVSEEDMECEYCVEKHRNGDCIIRRIADSTPMEFVVSEDV
jgi:hypothetical protein